MNGPQHFAAAQEKIKESGEVDGAYAMLTIQQAQAHATLALAAATIDASTRTDTHSGPGGYTSTQTDVANSVQWAGVLK
jgi:hypothetical protein